VQFSIGNNNEFGDAAPKVQQRVHLDGRFRPPESRPRKQGETEVDGGGIQRVHRSVEIDAEVFLRIEYLGLSYEYLSEVRVDSPVAHFVGVGQGTAGYPPTYTHVVEPGRHGSQTRFYIAQAFAISEFCKGHTQELVHTGE